jgi:small subunit ribosomal protein S20
MPNIKSAEKRVLIGKARNARNKANKSALRTVLKKFDTAVAGGDRGEAEATYQAAVKSVDRAVTKGLLHKNNAARKKSRMASELNALSK